MAGNYNKVLLLGNLTRDIELKHTPSNMAIGNLGLAVNRRWTSPEGEKKEETTFVDCEAYGKTAETMAKYLSKGRSVFIEGRLKLDQWTDKNDGTKRSKLKVVVDTFQFVESAGSGGGGGGGGGAARSSGGGGGEYDGGDPNDAPRPQVRTRPAARPQAAAPEITEDDIPF
jgi:single-strand DNA-binding protein